MCASHYTTGVNLCINVSLKLFLAVDCHSTLVEICAEWFLQLPHMLIGTNEILIGLVYSHTSPTNVRGLVFTYVPLTCHISPKKPASSLSGFARIFVPHRFSDSLVKRRRSP
jgi:hypothetical protein